MGLPICVFRSTKRALRLILNDFFRCLSANEHPLSLNWVIEIGHLAKDDDFRPVLPRPDLPLAILADNHQETPGSHSSTRGLRIDRPEAFRTLGVIRKSGIVQRARVAHSSATHEARITEAVCRLQYSRQSIYCQTLKSRHLFRQRTYTPGSDHPPSRRRPKILRFSLGPSSAYTFPSFRAAHPLPRPQGSRPIWRGAIRTSAVCPLLRSPEFVMDRDDVTFV